MSNIVNNGKYIIVNINNVDFDYDTLIIRVYYDNNYKCIYYNLTENFVLFEFNQYSSVIKIEVFNKISDSYEDIIYDLVIRFDPDFEDIQNFNNKILSVEYKKILIN